MELYLKLFLFLLRNYYIIIITLVTILYHDNELQYITCKTTYNVSDWNEGLRANKYLPHPDIIIRRHLVCVKTDESETCTYLTLIKYENQI